jgi:predicted enzyme related to lactoylglutathione lyase
MTKQYGAEFLIYGQITSLGNEYRITVYATDVEKASSSQRACNVRPDNRLASLLNASAEDEIERAVSEMAKAVNQKTTISIGRISYADTQTVSNFSAWLKNSVI